MDSTYYYLGAPETAGTNIYRKVYSHDFKGNTTGYIETMLTVGESAWKTSGGWIYAINSSGKITESASYSYYPGSQYPVWQFRYVSDYDILGNLVQIEFIDTSGRIVRTLSDVDGYNTIIIQRGTLPKGIYLLRIFSSSVSTEKIICR